MQDKDESGSEKEANKEKDEDKTDKVNFTEGLYKRIIEKAKIGTFAG